MKGAGGDVYAGADGNVYKKTDSGWQKYNDGSWSSVQSPSRQNATAQTGTRNAATQPASSANLGQLDQDREARTMGAQRQQQFRGSGGQEFTGGGAGRAGAGGRRR